MSSTLREYRISDADQDTAKQVDFSVVIPVYNEEDSIPHLHAALQPVLDSIDRPCEVILIDDGSRDGTYRELRKMHETDARYRIIRFRRNFGQTAAMAAGFAHARGGVIVTLDADLQNDPADIPMMLGKIEEGFDVVSGWRVQRKDKFITRRLPSVCANWLISRITGVNLHDYGCTLKAYRREVAQGIFLYGELHRFIPAMASWMGVSVAEVAVNHHSRKYGTSKYGLSRTLRVMVDLIGVKFLLSYSTKPLRVFGSIGFVSSLLGLGIGAYLSIGKLFYSQSLTGRPLLFLAVLLTMLGIQFITMGLLGEMMVRIYHDGQNKPVYVIKETLD